MFICTRCQRDVGTEGLFCPFCGAAAPQGGSEPGDPHVGRTVAQKYFVHQLLGRGGMGQVYKATHLTLDRPVVLKMLNHALSADPAIVQRFHREARAASRLNHPNSINVIDFGQAEDGTLFMAMEYLPGRSLARVIFEDFPLATSRTVKIGSQILAALTEAHAIGILHRDLKPDNVMVESRRDESDFVKVLDFGIAQLSEGAGTGGPRLTQAGMVCGTPGYMSPEQARGEELDARSDLYSVGTVLYELLTSKLPFEGATPQALVAKVLVEEPIPLRERRPELSIPPDLEALVMSALAPEREGRPGSAEEFRRALLACAPLEAQPARQTPAPSSRETVQLEAGAPLPKRSPRSDARRPAAGAALHSQPPSPAPAPPRPPTPARGKPARSGPGVQAPTPMPEHSATPRPAARRLARPTPRPRIDSDDADEIEVEDATPPPPPASSRRWPLIFGSVAGALLLGALLAWGVTRGRDRPGPLPALPRPELALRGPRSSEPRDLAVRPAQAPASAPAQAPAAQASPAVATADPPSARAPPAAPASPSTSASSRAAARESPAPASAGRAPRTRRSSGNPIRETGESLESLATPPESSGEGILAVLAAPWAEVSIDGRDIGETPREVRIAAGTYRVRATHPELGTTQQSVTVAAGKRQIWQASFAR